MVYKLARGGHHHCLAVQGNSMAWNEWYHSMVLMGQSTAIVFHGSPSPRKELKGHMMARFSFRCSACSTCTGTLPQVRCSRGNGGTSDFTASTAAGRPGQGQGQAAAGILARPVNNGAWGAHVLQQQAAAVAVASRQGFLVAGVSPFRPCGPCSSSSS